MYLHLWALNCKYYSQSRRRFYHCQIVGLDSHLMLLSELSVNGVALKVDKYKHLGIWITSNPSWSKQVNEVCHKARQKVGILFWKYYQHTSTSTLPKL